MTDMRDYDHAPLNPIAALVVVGVMAGLFFLGGGKLGGGDQEPAKPTLSPYGWHHPVPAGYVRAGFFDSIACPPDQAERYDIIMMNIVWHHQPTFVAGRQITIMDDADDCIRVDQYDSNYKPND